MTVDATRPFAAAAEVCYWKTNITIKLGRAPRVELERERPVLARRDQRQRAAVERAAHGRPPAAAHVASRLDVGVVGEARGARGVAVAVACVEIKFWAPHAIDATLSR